MSETREDYIVATEEMLNEIRHHKERSERWADGMRWMLYLLIAVYLVLALYVGPWISREYFVLAATACLVGIYIGFRLDVVGNTIYAGIVSSILVKLKTDK